MQNPAARLRIALIAASVIFVVAVIVIVFATVRGNSGSSSTGTPSPSFNNELPSASSTPEPLSQTKVDPLSDEIVFIGLDGLVEHGLTNTQLSNFQYAVKLYSTSKTHLHQIQINADSVHRIANPNFNNDGLTFYGFSGTIDESTPLTAKIGLADLNLIRLYMYDPTGKTILFDSGPITAVPDED
jgi:hypothetical protein